MDNDSIKVKAMCLFEHEGKLLASKGFDPVKQESFYRVLGGHLDFGEVSEAGVRREIREELHSGIDNLEFLKVIENIFTYHGKPGHEIVFLYKGDLSDKRLYGQKSITIVEPDKELEAIWVPKEDIFEKKIPLYPDLDYRIILRER